MKPDPLPAILCPHGWRKLEQARHNVIRFELRYGKKNYRRVRKWARVADRWNDRIYNPIRWL